MFVEKKTFGQVPFCSRALTSVPGASAPSLATLSQPPVLNPGAEICAPVCVAVALVSTFQPAAPRSTTAVDPVGGAAAGLNRATGRGAGRCAAAPVTDRDVATTPSAASTHHTGF